jgi:hypothetical protein
MLVVAGKGGTLGGRGVREVTVTGGVVTTSLWIIISLEALCVRDPDHKGQNQKQATAQKSKVKPLMRRSLGQI